MVITKRAPNTIYLGGPRTEIGDIAAGEAITPGMLIERYNSSGTMLLRKHSVSGGAGAMFATEQNMLNRGVNDDYNVGDLVEATMGAPGTKWQAIIASGASITQGDKLESAGNGKLKAYSAGLTAFTALETKTGVLADTRIRVEVA